MASTIALTIALTLTAPTTPIPDMAGWEAAWHDRVAAEGALTPALVEERRTILTLQPARPPVQPPVAPKPSLRPPTPPPADVEAWRPLVAAWFAPEHVDRALRVMACESGGNPTIRNLAGSSALGLFQFIRSTWDWQAGILGLPTYDQGGPLDPEANVRAAANLSRQGADWSHWSCKP